MIFNIFCFLTHPTLHILCWGGDTAQHIQEKLSCGWVGGPDQEIIPLRGSILQAETCQILSLAENPRWSPSVAILLPKNLCEVDKIAQIVIFCMVQIIPCRI